MEQAVHRKISVTKLRLDQNNPRYPPTSNQVEAFDQMMRMRRSEIYKIAKHIVDNGLNESVSPIIYETPDGECIVKDGNRRITALKAIHNPRIIKGDKNDRYKKQFELLHQRSLEMNLKSIRCAVYYAESDADYWVEHNHIGSDGGAGHQEWDAEQKMRYKSYRSGNPDPTIEIYDMIIRDIDLDLLKKQPPISTLERLIGYKDVRAELGFDVVNGKVILSVEEEDFIRDWTYIITQLGNEELKVGAVIDSKAAVKYISDAREEARTRGERLFDPRPISETTPLTPEPSVETPADKIDLPEKKKEKGEQKTTGQRKTMIPSHCILSIEQTRINNIYHELKYTSMDKCVNAMAISLRVFLELSVDHYIEKHPGCIRMSEGKENYLHHRIAKVAEHMKMEKTLDADKGAALKKACTSDPYKIEMTTELNQYVHNPHFNPDVKTLKGLWDNLESFIVAIWEKSINVDQTTIKNEDADGR